MENQISNQVNYKDIEKKKHARFSINGKIVNSRKSRNSLLVPLITDSGNSSPINFENSSDAEWARICNKVANIPEYRDSEEELLFNPSNRDFNSPTGTNKSSSRISEGRRSQPREIANLTRQSAELDDEIEYYHACIDEIQQNFISMFSDIQKRRLHTICARKGIPPPNAAQIFAAVEALDLSSMEPIEWAPSMEKAINALIE